MWRFVTQHWGLDVSTFHDVTTLSRNVGIRLPSDLEERNPHCQDISFLLRVIVIEDINTVLLLWVSWQSVLRIRHVENLFHLRLRGILAILQYRHFFLLRKASLELNVSTCLFQRISRNQFLTHPFIIVTNCHLSVLDFLQNYHRIYVRSGWFVFPTP
jgi:hypothetical protein